MNCEKCGAKLSQYIAENVKKGDFDQLCNVCAAKKWGIEEADKVA